MWSGEGRVYANFALTLEAERPFSIDPQLKEKTVQSSIEKEITETEKSCQNTIDNLV